MHYYENLYDVVLSIYQDYLNGYTGMTGQALGETDQASSEMLRDMVVGDPIAGGFASNVNNERQRKNRAKTSVSSST